MGRGPRGACNLSNGYRGHKEVDTQVFSGGLREGARLAIARLAIGAVARVPGRASEQG
jgi:hypothetical protein